MFRGSIFRDMIVNNDDNAQRAKLAIQKFCKDGSSRQRSALYDFLDQELGITINRFNKKLINQRRDNPRFECTNKQEVSNVTYRIMMELKSKK